MSRERGPQHISSLREQKNMLEYVRDQRRGRIERLTDQAGSKPLTSGVEAILHDIRLGEIIESTHTSIVRISEKIDAVDHQIAGVALDGLKALVDRGALPQSVYEKRFEEVQALYGDELSHETAAIVPETVTPQIDSSPHVSEITSLSLSEATLQSVTSDMPSVSGQETQPVISFSEEQEKVLPDPGALPSPKPTTETRVAEQIEQVESSNPPTSRQIKVTISGRTEQFLFGPKPGHSEKPAILTALELIASGGNEGVTPRDIAETVAPSDPESIKPLQIIGNLRAKFRQAFGSREVISTLGEVGKSRYIINPDVSLSFLDAEVEEPQMDISMELDNKSSQRAETIIEKTLAETLTLPEQDAKPAITPPTAVESNHTADETQSMALEAAKTESKSVTFVFRGNTESVDFRMIAARNISYDLLKYLNNNPGIITTSEELKRVIKPNQPQRVKDVMPYIIQLQNKLGDNTHERQIVIREGVGKAALFGLNSEATFFFPDEPVEESEMPPNGLAIRGQDNPLLPESTIIVPGTLPEQVVEMQEETRPEPIPIAKDEEVELPDQLQSERQAETQSAADTSIELEHTTESQKKNNSI